MAIKLSISLAHSLKERKYPSAVKLPEVNLSKINLLFMKQKNAGRPMPFISWLKNGEPIKAVTEVT